MMKQLRAGFGTESSTSIISSTSISSSGSLNSPKDFHEVKEIVKEISRRLDVLEKVFVFVDLEQINQALASFSATAGISICKAGTDISFSSKLDPTTTEDNPTPRDAAEYIDSPKTKAAVPKTPAATTFASEYLEPHNSPVDGARDLKGEWQNLSEGRLAPGSMRSIKPSSQHDISFQTRGRLQPLAAPKSKTKLRVEQAAKMFPATGYLQEVPESSTGFSACTVDLQDDVRRGTDRRDKLHRSTSSKKPVSTPEVEDDEEDIEPERCNNFVKQALQSSKAKQAWMDRVSRMREKSAVDPAWSLEDS